MVNHDQMLLRLQFFLLDEEKRGLWFWQTWTNTYFGTLHPITAQGFVNPYAQSLWLLCASPFNVHILLSAAILSFWPCILG